MTKKQRQALLRLLDETEKTMRALPSEVLQHRVREAVMDVRTAFHLFEARPLDEVQLALFELPVEED